MKIKTIYIKLLSLLFFIPILAVAQSSSIELSRSLRLGSHGEDVKVLQRLLSENSEVYPKALVTGYFGLKTHLLTSVPDHFFR